VVPRILRALAAEIRSRRRTRWMSGELVAALRELEHRLGRAEALAELTVRSETSLREDLERVREKRARHQEEAERLRAELEAERARGFWQRLFGE
jgi:predicted nuclease with TOPRIM domain